MPAETHRARIHWSALGWLATLACLSVLIVLVLRPASSVNAPLAPPAAERASASARPASALEGESRPTGDTRQAAPAAAAEEPGPARKLGQCSVLVRAVDSQTGAPLERLRVRAASATRIADRENTTGADLQLRLSPDRYDLLLLSRGYESLEIGPIALAWGDAVVLPQSSMQAGSARITGFANGEPAGLRVELTGEGRRPCPACAASDPRSREAAWNRLDPCPTCGFTANATLLALSGAGRFEFDRLVSGSYLVRLVDASLHTIGMPQVVELGPGQSLSLELDAGWRRLELELLDVDGKSLAREWAARLAAPPPPEDDDSVEIVVEEGAIRPLSFECTLRSEDTCLARADLAVPEPPGRAPRGFTSIGVGSHHGIRKGSGKSSVDDRPRASSDRLHPEARALEIQPTMLGARLDSEGRACFEPLPPSALVLQLVCGPYKVSVEIPASRTNLRLRAQLVHALADAPSFLEYEAGAAR